MMDYSVFLIGMVAFVYVILDLWSNYRSYRETNFEPVKAYCDYKMYKKYGSMRE